LKRVLPYRYITRFGYSLQIGRKLSQDVVHQSLPGCFPSLVTTTMQPLWNPAQPQSEQRQLIPPDSFLLFLPTLLGKTILAESHSGQWSILLDMKVVSTDSHGDLQLSGSCWRGLNLCDPIDRSVLRTQLSQVDTEIFGI